MGRARLACVVIALGALVCTAAPPAQSAGQPAAPGAAKPAAPAAAQSDAPSSAAITRLTKEKAALSAELVKKDQQIAALTRLLKENGIDVPDEAGGAPAAAGPSAAARPAAKRSSATEVSEADAAPAAPAPATKGPWEVSVVSNAEPSQNELKDQLAEAIGKLKFADQQLFEAKQRHDRMASEREWYVSNRGRGDYKPKFTNAQMAEPRREVAKAEADKRRASQTVARIERQIADAGKTHMVVGQLADGTTVELTAAGPAQVQLARGLQVGERYRIAGTARVDEGTLRVRMSSAVPIAGGGGAAPRAAAGRTAGAPRRPSPVPVPPTAADEAMEEADETAGEPEPEAEVPVAPPARRPQPRPPQAQPKATPF